MLRLLYALVLPVAASFWTAPVQARLLGVVVGVSQYDNPVLARSALPGAAVDAADMAAALRLRGADARDIAVLSGSAATAAAIRIAIAQTVASAMRGDRVVLYLSGHGAQLPARAGDPIEPDGLDEAFLAADAGSWNDRTRSLPGAVKDDEFGVWIDQFRAKGASVWFVVDACNGGGLQRGSNLEASARVIDPALLGLPAPMRGGVADVSGLADATPITGGGKLVTFYAAPAGGVAWERPLPDAVGVAVRRGVFTWALLKAHARTPDDANFMALAGSADAARTAIGPPGGPAWISGDLDQRFLFVGNSSDLLATAQAFTGTPPVALRIAVGADGGGCPGAEPDPARLAAPLPDLHVSGCRRILVELRGTAPGMVTMRPWYRDAAGAYVALTGARGLAVSPGEPAQFSFTITDRDPATGRQMASGQEYLLLIADGQAGAIVVPVRTGPLTGTPR